MLTSLRIFSFSWAPFSRAFQYLTWRIKFAEWTGTHFRQTALKPVPQMNLFAFLLIVILNIYRLTYWAIEIQGFQLHYKYWVKLQHWLIMPVVEVHEYWVQKCCFFCNVYHFITRENGISNYLTEFPSPPFIHYKESSVTLGNWQDRKGTAIYFIVLNMYLLTRWNFRRFSTKMWWLSLQQIDQTCWTMPCCVLGGWTRLSMFPLLTRRYSMKLYTWLKQRRVLFQAQDGKQRKV